AERMGPVGPAHPWWLGPRVLGSGPAYGERHSPGAAHRGFPPPGQESALVMVAGTCRDAPGPGLRPAARSARAVAVGSAPLSVLPPHPARCGLARLSDPGGAGALQSGDPALDSDPFWAFLDDPGSGSVPQLGLAGCRGGPHHLARRRPGVRGSGAGKGAL